MPKANQLWATDRRRIFMAAGLVLMTGYGVMAVMTNTDRVVDALRSLGISGCAVVLALSLVNYVMRFFRWDFYLASFRRNIPRWRHFLYYVGGFAFTVSPAKAGEAVRALYLRGHGVTYVESISALFAERLLDLFVIVILSSLVLLGGTRYRALVLLSLLTVLIGLVAIGTDHLQRWLDAAAQRLAGRRGGQALRSFNRLLRASKELLRPRLLFFGLLIGLVAWGAEAVGFVMICRTLHIEGQWEVLMGIYAVSVLAGSVAFFVPAGIGSMEIAMTTLLLQQRSSLPDAVLATLLCRIATLWFAVLIGIAAAVFIETFPRGNAVDGAA